MLRSLWGWIIDRLKQPECHKTSLGYNCYHRVYQDGTKECGRGE